MTIDGCEHQFEALVASVLPGHMTRLETAMSEQWLMADFAKTGVGVRSLLKAKGYGADFRGCYVMSDEQKPIYVGISQHVLARLRQHVVGRTHYDASLAYRMARHELAHEKTRGEAMKDTAFKDKFDEKQRYLRSLRVAAVKIDNPVELYLFEVFAAMKLGTSLWNTFETH